jgi:cell wall assembly regulator SMI1
MSSAKKTAIALISIAFLLVVLLITALPSMLRSFFYPKPDRLPPCVEATMEELLPRLQTVLEKDAPMVAHSLQPGLSDKKIAQLETEGGFHLSNELKSLYRWHNGTASNMLFGLLPGQQFPPLENVVAKHKILHQQLSSTSGIQKAAAFVFTSHMKSWIHVFDDGAGDGYFYDPERAESEGAFFFHFNQTAQFVWFPCFRNFLSGVIECYETGVVKTAPDGKVLNEDYEKSQKIWDKFGKDSENGT